MIRIKRGQEPKELRLARNAGLTTLRGIARTTPPTSKEIVGYDIVGQALWESQHQKCCYCEQRIKKRYNDVEHYRPKAEADRRPGSSQTHGYWWLAFTWKNLLFACPSCNRSEKGCQFPLRRGDTPLQAEEQPPGKERPYLIDPTARINPVEHIQFIYRLPKANEPLLRIGIRQWLAHPRNGSIRGNFTIDVCGLNDPELVELRDHHVTNVVEPQAEALRLSLVEKKHIQINREWKRSLGLLDPRSEFVALTYDALRFLVPEASLVGSGFAWPEPQAIGVPPP